MRSPPATSSSICRSSRCAPTSYRTLSGELTGVENRKVAHLGHRHVAGLQHLRALSVRATCDLSLPLSLSCISPWCHWAMARSVLTPDTLLKSWVIAFG